MSVVQENRRAQNHHRVIARELIRKWLLRRQQPSAKQPVPARESATRSDRLLVGIRIDVFCERNNFLPAPVFFNLSAYHESGIAARIERGNHLVKRDRVRKNSLMHSADFHWLAFMSPVVHGKGKEYRSSGGRHRQIIRARDSLGQILGSDRSNSTFHERR